MESVTIPTFVIKKLPYLRVDLKSQKSIAAWLSAHDIKIAGHDAGIFLDYEKINSNLTALFLVIRLDIDNPDNLKCLIENPRSFIFDRYNLITGRNPQSDLNLMYLPTSLDIESDVCYIISFAFEGFIARICEEN